MFTGFLLSFRVFAATNCNPGGFLGFPTWYKYLTIQSTPDPYTGGVSCNVSGFSFWPPTDFLLVFLAVLDILLYVAGMVAVVFVIYGGVKYILSQGNPENTKKAQTTIINALIGMVIAILATTVVNFVGQSIS